MRQAVAPTSGNPTAATEKHSGARAWQKESPTRQAVFLLGISLACTLTPPVAIHCAGRASQVFLRPMTAPWQEALEFWLIFSAMMTLFLWAVVPMLAAGVLYFLAIAVIRRLTLQRS